MYVMLGHLGWCQAVFLGQPSSSPQVLFDGSWCRMGSLAMSRLFTLVARFIMPGEMHPSGARQGSRLCVLQSLAVYSEEPQGETVGGGSGKPLAVFGSGVFGSGS